jgi:hypothetical protein
MTMIVQWREGGVPHSVVVGRAYAGAVARVLVDDLGLPVTLNDERVHGPASPGDRALFEQWQRGGPDHGGEG